jgi:hypothetical protein
MNEVETVVGISGEKANAAFHKSWEKVATASIEQLVLEQIVHYITTYGYQAVGIYSDDTVYIPHEQLDLPELSDDIPLTVVKAMTEDDIIGAILGLGSSGVALSTETLDDIMVILEDSNFLAHIFVESITNRELKARIFARWNLVPTDPEEWLRYIVALLTGESLLIKNKYLIGKIKEADGKLLDTYLADAPKNLASIFYRYKPLFLAMKSISSNKTFFNRLRKAAPKQHKPVRPDYLATLTEHIGTPGFVAVELPFHLEEASFWRKVRLAHALSFRMSHPTSILYKVRNGRSYVTDFQWPVSTETTAYYLNMVIESIAMEDALYRLDGQVIYIPEGVSYPLPASEKQFVGNVPAGTSVAVPEDMLVGIHWFNNTAGKTMWSNGVVDLDLSLVSVGGKIGWDASYRNQDVLFSGDVTSAPKPKGASELFYIKHNAEHPYLLSVNYYNYISEDECEAKIIVARQKPHNFGKNYMVDVSNIVASANINVTDRQTILGVVSDNTFYFWNTGIGRSITTSADKRATQTREYLITRCQSLVPLDVILELAGATIVHKRPEKGDYIDLSPENLDKTTILNLLT